jgi:DNA-binding response OmpR family regulator
MRAKPALARVLYVEDDRALAGVVAAALAEEGYEITLAHDGREGMKQVDQGAFDLLLLDVMMPELDGLELCRRVRKTSRMPIIFLSSRADELDRVMGLEIGADDYLAKPFSVRELVSRIRAIARRMAGGIEDNPLTRQVSAGELSVDPSRFEVTWRGRPVTLTRSELLVLHALAARPGFVLSRDQLIQVARGGDAVITERTIDTFIKRIRAKLRAVDESFDAVETVIGVGYRLKKTAQ